MPFKFRSNSLRTRIITWSFIPSMIISIAVAVFIFFAYSNVTEDLIIEQNKDSARFEANQFTNELKEYEDFLISEARMLGVLPKESLFQETILSSSSNRFAVFDGGVILLDNYGTVLATEPDRLGILGNDWSDHDFYVQIAGSGISTAAVFSDIVEDELEGEDVIIVAVPIIDNQNRFVGILAGMFRVGTHSVSAFYGDIVKLNWGEGKNVYVVDSRGTVVYDTNTDDIGKNLSSQEAVIRVVSGGSGALRVTDPEKGNLLVTFSPVPGTPWGLLIEKNWNTLLSSNQSYRAILILLLILGMLVPAIIVFFGVRQITRPIAEIIGAAKEIATGNFSHRINPATGDELEELADQFNTMTNTLEELYNTLEEKVADRTRGERQRAEQLRTINEVGRKISSILDLDELLPSVTATLHDTFQYYNVSIYLRDQNSPDLILKANSGVSKTSGDIGIPSKSISRIAASAAHTGNPIVINNIATDPEYIATDGTGDIKAEMAVPIIIGNRIIGVLDIEGSIENVFDELDLFTVQTLADQLAIAIENTRLYEHAGEMATIEERNRLARDLHDAVSQTLFSASLIAEVLPTLWEKDSEKGKERLEEVRQLTRGALAEMRTLLLELRPSALIEADLPHLLEQLAEAITGRTTIPVVVTSLGDCVLPDDAKVGFYRIAQEALNNVAKHSEATEVLVSLICEKEKVTLKIKDNGVGFDIDDISPESLGVGIMQERADDIGAEIWIKSQVGEGTEIEIIWHDKSKEEIQ
ncbi:histidine kinase [Chloroflexota bacterium]